MILNRLLDLPEKWVKLQHNPLSFHNHNLIPTKDKIRKDQELNHDHLVKRHDFDLCATTDVLIFRRLTSEDVFAASSLVSIDFKFETDTKKLQLLYF